MPLFQHFGSWLVDGFIMTLSMVISAFNYALQTPIIVENGLLEFTVDSGRMIICCLRDEFHLSLNTQTPEFNMTFNIDLRLEDHESNSDAAPEQQDPPFYFPQQDPPSYFLQQDPPSYFPQPDQHLVLPGVPFELPCPICSRPLE